MTCRALLKTVLPEDRLSRASLAREFEAYSIPSIASCPSVRSMYDIVGDSRVLDSDDTGDPPWLVLEWLDCTLADISPEHYGLNTILLKAILEAGLSSIAELQKHGLINTGKILIRRSSWRLTRPDIKSANILLSNINSASPMAKIGDLGLGLSIPFFRHRHVVDVSIVYPDGYRKPAQPFNMRAPEVYQGFGCTHKSTIWALAATLICWIRPGILGTPGNRFRLPVEGWCIAKFLVLFPDWVDPSTDNESVQADFNLGKAIAGESVKQGQNEYVNLSPFDDEVKGINLSNELKDLFRHLLKVDPEMRPSATQALASSEFLTLAEAAAATYTTILL